MTGRIGKFVRNAGFVAAFIFMFHMAAYAEDTTQFVPGTSVNGIGVGGLTVDAAKAQIEGFYDNGYKLTITKKGGSTETIDGAEIGYKATVADGLQAILDAQNASGRSYGPTVDNSHTLQMNTVYDDAALTARIHGLSCISGSDIVITADAHISAYEEGKAFTIIPEVQGNNVDAAKVEALIKEAVASGSASVNLEDSGCYLNVSITAQDEQLKNLCDTMNQCKDMVITYVFGDSSEQLSGALICSWITGSEGGQIGVNRDAAAAYIQTLADKYNTAGTARTFHTASGRDVSVSGAYGWKLDVAAETDALIGMIRTAQTQSREPQYSVKAASRAPSDWGSTYVEIDLSGQHVYMFRDGVLAWDAPCVTGNVSKGHTTPEGIYSLAYKQKDRVLRGAKRADGSYEYESPVDYWMPFNGGIGLHDANWRGKFGGTIYKKSGSHGCINLPPSKAKALYDLVYPGIPVICYN